MLYQYVMTTKLQLHPDGTPVPAGSILIRKVKPDDGDLVEVLYPRTRNMMDMTKPNCFSKPLDDSQIAAWGPFSSTALKSLILREGDEIEFPEWYHVGFINKLSELLERHRPSLQLQYIAHRKYSIQRI